jgi:23S rRNA pseudouridine2605 synthase
LDQSGTYRKKTGERDKSPAGNSGKPTGGKTAKSGRTPAGKSWNSGKPTAGKTGSGGTFHAGRGKAGPGRKSGPSARTDEPIRLNRYIASSGICSRREADQLITAGLITVNGKPVSELGIKVLPGDEVRYNGNLLRNERKVYLVLNKPKDYVTTTDDPNERKTVMQLVRNACPERIYPVGRLDRQTTGVLMFTNDGDLARNLTHPSNNKKKIYHIHLDKAMGAGDLAKLAAGITLEDGFIQPDAVSYASTDNKREIGLEIHSGRNRIVRRMFEHLGYRVNKLDRVYFAGLTKKNLPRGKWRFLTVKEVNLLKMNAFE